MRGLLKVTLALVALGSICATAQDKPKKDIEKANNLYEKYAYIDAIKIYERIAQDGYVDQDMLQKIGNSYYFNADYKSALVWYDKLFAMREKNSAMNIPAEYFYRYAQTLKSGQKYQDADKILSEFMSMASSTDRRVNLYNSSKDYMKEIEDNSNRLSLKNLSINTEHSEYGTAFFGAEEVVFTASRKAGLFKKSASWTGDGYYDLYKAKKEGDDLKNEELFSSVLNTTLNESSPVFTKDLKTVYFSRNNFTKGKKKTDSNNTVLLKLYRSDFKDGQWSEAVELPFNSDSYSTSHPALSPDGKYLYFASDMPGTKGLSDIFKVEINSDGKTYGAPENLGEKINTEVRETFPYVDENGILYFSSEGHPGLGGLDIFAAKLNQYGEVEKVVNVGKPANSSLDDFAFIFDSGKKTGFLSSNRSGGKGKDDIYSFVENTPIKFEKECKKIIKGIVRDFDTREILTDVAVTLSDKRQSEITGKKNSENGEFEFQEHAFGCADDYAYVRAQKENYGVEENRVELVEENGEAYVEILLKATKKPVKEGDDLSKILRIDMIYFDFDKSNIREDAAIELAKIKQVMMENPTMVIDIRSHTDSRGSDSYNLALSDRRAKSTMKWLIEQGIAKERLSAKGYGETRLVNGCSNGVSCTIEEHQQNRRSEFIIVKM